MAINELSISTCVFGAERGPREMLGDYMELALNAGFKMVEISHAVPEKESSMNAFRNSGIKVWSIHGVMGMGAISPDKAERDKAVELAYRHAAGKLPPGRRIVRRNHLVKQTDMFPLRLFHAEGNQQFPQAAVQNRRRHLPQNIHICGDFRLAFQSLPILPQIQRCGREIFRNTGVFFPQKRHHMVP